MLADGIVLTNLTDRQRFPPYGLAGGADGRLGETILNPGEHQETIGSKDVRLLAEGDVISFRCSGSGGFGPPSERPREAVAHDVAEGVISREAAENIYGWNGEPQ
jgi:N-methylhydantoinase B